MSLRTKFFVAILLAGIVPLAGLGYWLTHRAERSGEALLRSRLESSLEQVAREVGSRWIELRSGLLDLAEHRLGTGGPGPARPDLPEAVAAVTFRAEGAPSSDTAWRLAAAEPRERGSAAMRARPLEVEIPVFEPGDRLPVGHLTAGLRPESLLPSGLWWTTVGGSVLSLHSPDGRTALSPAAIEPELLLRRRFRWGGRPWIAVQRRLTEPNVLLSLAAPLDPVLLPFRTARREGTLALLGVTVFALLVAALAAGQLTASLRTLATAADAVAEGDLDRTVAVDSEDEIGRLARAFNRMTESLRTVLRQLSDQQSLAALGRFASTVVHEVRNPLSSMRLDAQRLQEALTEEGEKRRMADRLLRKVNDLEGVTTGILRLARSGDVELRPLELGEPIRRAADSARPAFRERGAILRVEELPPLPIEGDLAALERLFVNLLLNAAEALPEGGEAEIGVAPSPDGDAAVVTVRDGGPGMPAEVRDRATEPFFTTRSDGTGLGLAVAEQIVRAHAGSMTLESEPGRGTRVAVRLPLAPRASPEEA